MNVQPKISVITVCYNAAKTIEQTIKSVLDQTYPSIEYIIIDGDSADNTLSIIEKYRDKINVLVSEKDSGLYDAMNKGLKQATGDYVFFLNADDVFYDHEVLSHIFSRTQNELQDVYYGEVMLMDENGQNLGLRSEMTTQVVPEQLTWKSLKYGMVVSHQAFIVKRELAAEYDPEFKLCADIDWMIKCLKNSKSCYNTHVIISRFRAGGVSKQRQKQSWLERYRILSKHYGFAGNFIRHGLIAFRYLINKKY